MKGFGGFMDLEAFREQLVIWGVTPQVLAAIGVVSLIILFFSLRITTKWFMGFYQIQDELTQVRKQLAIIQSQLTMNNATPNKLQDALDEPVGIKATPSKTDAFRLTNH
jgi:hypothetical protein